MRRRPGGRDIGQATHEYGSVLEPRRAHDALVVVLVVVVDAEGADTALVLGTGPDERLQSCLPPVCLEKRHAVVMTLGFEHVREERDLGRIQDTTQAGLPLGTEPFLHNAS